jgi:hypothetical protein
MPAPHASPLARRILIAIGAAGLSTLSLGADACGGDTTVGSPSADASMDATEGSQDAAADAVNDVAIDSPACVRRPFLVGGATRAGTASARADWGRADVEGIAGMDAVVRHALAAAWREDGLQEHASIAAFARFTLRALAVGAPPEHVVGAQRASLDEVAHARACFALAKRYGGDDVGPGPIPLDGALTPLSLADLAALTVHEGCVGETLGVELARAQLAAAGDALVRATLDRVVRDETRHAELAWSFVRWAIDVGGDDVRRAVARAFAEATAASRALTLAPDPGAATATEWRTHGRLMRSEARKAVEATLRAIVEPCARVLLDRTTRAVEGLRA